MVQLKHVSSGKFLVVKRTAADCERGALKVGQGERGGRGGGGREGERGGREGEEYFVMPFVMALIGLLIPADAHPAHAYALL